MNAPSGRRPKTKPDDLGCESPCTGCQSLHPLSPFIIITQPESWYSFYRPTEGRRLSRPSWLVTYRDGLPVGRRSPILVLTGFDVTQLRWSRPTRYHSNLVGMGKERLSISWVLCLFRHVQASNDASLLYHNLFLCMCPWKWLNVGVVPIPIVDLGALFHFPWHHKAGQFTIFSRSVDFSQLRHADLCPPPSGSHMLYCIPPQRLISR